MEKCRNLKNEIKTRWGDSINLLYCSHLTNKSRRSYIYKIIYKIYVTLSRALPRLGGVNHKCIVCFILQALIYQENCRYQCFMNMWHFKHLKFKPYFKNALKNAKSESISPLPHVANKFDHLQEFWCSPQYFKTIFRKLAAMLQKTIFKNLQPKVSRAAKSTHPKDNFE